MATVMRKECAIPPCIKTTGLPAALPVRPIPVTRVLTDEYDLFYDMYDLFPFAEEGKMWVSHWMCGGNRTLQVGDAFFLLDSPYHWWTDLEEDCTEDFPERGIFASGHLIADDAHNQLRLLDGEAYGDLSAAYGNNPYREDDLKEGKNEIFYVRFSLDSIVHPEHLLPIHWLQGQSDCQDLFRNAPYSGDIIPVHLVAFLNAYWDDHVRRLEAEKLALRLDLR